MRWSLIVIVATLVACSKPERGDRQLDYKRDIEVVSDAKMRTDTVGEGRFAYNATFVLVDATNHASEGAYVTLDGTLGDKDNKEVAKLKAASLWIPAGESRTFALVDTERVARPTAVGARVEIRGAVITGFSPVARLSDIKSIDDQDKIIMQAVLENPSDRLGKIVVIGSFHDAVVGGTPMTRPFDVVNLEPKEKRAVQFVGPKGSKRGAMYVGEEGY